MGCVNSRTDINDLHPNIFQVMNVDELGNLITSGRLEVTDLDIVLHQRGKQPVKWPLRCLRRYGYDAEIFSFESGRRCSTGPGIYAFKCHKAEQLFTLVQTNIQVCNNSEDTISREISMSSHSAPAVGRTISSDPNYLDPIPVRANCRTGARFSHGQINGTGRLASVGSGGGPLSPQGTMGSPSPPLVLPPPPPSQPSYIPYLHPSSLYVNEEVLSTMTMEMEHNNNKSLRRTMQRSFTISSTSSSGMLAADQSSQDSRSKACYMNVDLNEGGPLSPSLSNLDSVARDDQLDEATKHEYMNIHPGQEHVDASLLKSRPPPLPPSPMDPEEGPRHCYANLEANEIESFRKRFSGVFVAEKTAPPSTPPSNVIREVNYAVLDLDTKENADLTTNTQPSPPDSPNRSQKSYATIDFNKTVALSHSVNPNLVNDNEGSRKTRHNSTINDFSDTKNPTTE